MRGWSRPLGAAVLMILSAACTGGGQPSASSPGAPVTLTLRDFSVEQADFHSQVATEYQRLNPNVTIKWESVAKAQYEQTLPLAFQSRQAPAPFYSQKQASNTTNCPLSNTSHSPTTLDSNDPP